MNDHFCYFIKSIISFLLTKIFSESFSSSKLSFFELERSNLKKKVHCLNEKFKKNQSRSTRYVRYHSAEKYKRNNFFDNDNLSEYQIEN